MKMAIVKAWIQQSCNGSVRSSWSEQVVDPLRERKVEPGGMTLMSGMYLATLSLCACSSWSESEVGPLRVGLRC